MKTIEIPGLVQGSDEWKRWRSTGIGGSDAPIIMLGNVYGKDPAALWREKCGYAEAVFDAQAQEHTKRGHELEPKAREEFIKRSGIWITPACMQSATHPYMLASLDGITPDGEVGCEIKAPAKRMFEEMLLNGTPNYYVDQIQHQIFVSGAREFYFWAYNPEITPYVFCERHEPNHGRIQEILRKEREFWRHVEMNVSPGDVLGVDKANIGNLGVTHFAGYAGTGKDTIGAIHASVFNTKRYSFADLLKQIYCKIHGITLLKLEAEKKKHRPALVAMGNGMREVDPDVWVNGVFNGRSGIYEDMLSNGAFITDTRFLNEASVGRKHAARLGVPFRLIWIERPGGKPANDSEATQTSLLRSMSDIIFVNDAEVNTTVGKLATEMALVFSMSVIPEGKCYMVNATNFLQAAYEELNEQARTKASKRPSKRTRK